MNENPAESQSLEIAPSDWKLKSMALRDEAYRLELSTPAGDLQIVEVPGPELHV